MKKISGSFVTSWLSRKHISRPQVRHTDPSRWIRAYCFFTCRSPVSHPPCSSYLNSVHTAATTVAPTKSLVARTARRILCPKRSGIFYIAAVNYPRDCLPRAPIVLRRSTHSHPRRPAFRLVPSFPLRPCKRLMYPRLVL